MKRTSGLTNYTKFLMKIFPKPEAFAREAIILIGGALLAAFILSRFPAVRSYINTNTKTPGCSCGG